MPYPTPLPYGPDHEPTHCEGCGAEVGEEPCRPECPQLALEVEVTRGRLVEAEGIAARGGVPGPWWSALARSLRKQLEALEAMQGAPV